MLLYVLLFRFLRYRTVPFRYLYYTTISAYNQRTKGTFLCYFRFCVLFHFDEETCSLPYFDFAERLQLSFPPDSRFQAFHVEPFIPNDIIVPVVIALNAGMYPAGCTAIICQQKLNARARGIFAEIILVSAAGVQVQPTRTSNRVVNVVQVVNCL